MDILDLPGTDLVAIDVSARLDALAKQHRAAHSIGMDVLNLLGAQAENLLERLPDTLKDRLENATSQALERAALMAQKSHNVVPDQAPWLNTAVATAMGAAGGAGGVPTALAEIPVTVTFLLRAIQARARAHGYDVRDTDVLSACLNVFATAGPLDADDGADMGFLSARLMLTGPNVQLIIARVAPRLATALGHKLATQAVPLIGAAAGAMTNMAYMRYYQSMADVQFGLQKLVDETGQDRDVLVRDLRQRCSKHPISRAD